MSFPLKIIILYKNKQTNKQNHKTPKETQNPKPKTQKFQNRCFLGKL